MKPDANEALTLLEALAAGSQEAAEQVADLLNRLLPQDVTARCLAKILRVPVAWAGFNRYYAQFALDEFVRAGLVPEASHLDNIPTALALRGRGTSSGPCVQ